MTQFVDENPKELDGSPDLCQLVFLGEDNVLKNLAIRYKQGLIYTSTTTKVLVAVNPYEKLPENDSIATLARYQAAAVNLEGILSGNDLSPHVFSVGHATYHNMVAFGRNQSIIVCGESGSGKTESAKLVMKFLAYTSTVTAVESQEYAEATRIGEQVLDANPILEAFGNAKTVLNNNSSRFGKFTKMMFAPRLHGGVDRQLVGAVIETYLLEKSRVCHQDPGERNYHVFYSVCSQALAHPEWRLGDGNPGHFRYLNPSGATQDAPSDAQDFNTLVHAMEVMEFSEVERAEILGCVAGILHLGNIDFVSHSALRSGGESCAIKDMTPVKDAAALLGLDAEMMVKRLLQREIAVNGATITKDRHKEDAEQNRDSIAKAAYNGLFRWIAARINRTSCPAGQVAQNSSWVGILDVFGFEIFTQNSLEQLCINLANERLQAYFNFHVLKAEQDLYRREALLWTPIDLPDNSDVIEMLLSKPVGVLALLDSACMQPKGSEQTFTDTLFQQFPAHHRLERVQLHRGPAKQSPKSRRHRTLHAMNGFAVRHYAGTVTYDARGFLSKNADSSHPANVTLFCDSVLPVCATLLSMAADGKVGERPQPGKSMKFRSTTAVFTRQLDHLIDTLDHTTPYFVRCIKPNAEKAAKKLVGEYVRPQLRYGGLVEALRILKCGFPTRCSYEKMYKLFGSVVEERFRDGRAVNKRDFTEAMVHVCGPEHIDATQYQLGLSMIFFRPGRQSFFQRILGLTKHDITPAQREELCRFLVHKKLLRLRGTVRGYLRLRRFRLVLKFQKAARALVVVHKTVGRALVRARARLEGKHAVQEEARLAKEREYLGALATARQVQQEQARLVAQLRERDTLLERAKAETAEANTHLRGCVAKLQALGARVGALEEQAAKDRSAAERALAERTTLLAQLQRLQDDKASLEADSLRSKTEAQRLQEGLRQQLSQVSATEREGRRTVDELQQDVQQQGVQITQYERKLRELQEEKNSLDEDHKVQERVLTLKLAELEAALEEERRLKNQALASAGGLQREAEAAREHAAEVGGQLQAEMARLAADVRAVQVKFEAAVAEKCSLHELHASIQAELNTLRNQKGEAEAEVARVTTKAQATEARLRTSQSAEAEANATIESLKLLLKQKTGAHDARVEESRKAMEEAAAARQSLSAAQRTLHDTEAGFERRVEAHKEAVAQLQRRFAITTAEIQQDAATEMASLHAETNAARREKQAAVARERALNLELELAKQRLTAMAQELSAARASNERLEEAEQQVCAQKQILGQCRRQAKAWVVTFEMLKTQAELELSRLDRTDTSAGSGLPSAAQSRLNSPLKGRQKDADLLSESTLLSAADSLGGSLAVGSISMTLSTLDAFSKPKTLNAQANATPTKVTLHGDHDDDLGGAEPLLNRGSVAGTLGSEADVEEELHEEDLPLMQQGRHSYHDQ